MLCAMTKISRHRYPRRPVLLAEGVSTLPPQLIRARTTPANPIPSLRPGLLSQSITSVRKLLVIEARAVHA